LPEAENVGSVSPPGPNPTFASASDESVGSGVPGRLERSLDERGNSRLVSEAVDGRRILVVVARDAQDFVITVFLRS
jgi:hypothetical protein